MEEENALKFQPTEPSVSCSVSCLVSQRPLPVRLEATHHEAEMF